jgi:heat shock protein HslJ
MTFRRRTLALSAVSLLLACDAGMRASGSALTRDAQDGDPRLLLAEWELTSFGGQAPIAGSRIALTFEDTTFGGYSGCNWYGGGYEVAGASLRMSDVFGTERACARPQGVMEQETRYLAALVKSELFQVTGEELTLRTDGGRDLRFRRVMHLDLNPADLVNTRWGLETMSGATPIAGSQITLNFHDGTMSGHAGCRGFTGTYVAQRDAIHFTSLSMTTTDCPAGGALLQQEGEYTTALSETTRYVLRAQALELHAAGGGVLVFRRQQ